MKFDYSDAVKEYLGDHTKVGTMQTVMIGEAVAKIMAKRAELMMPGVVSEYAILQEEWVRAAIGCSISCREDGPGLIVLFNVTAANIPVEAHGVMADAYEHIHDLLALVYEGGFRYLVEPEDFRRHPVPGFANLVLVTLSEEELSVGQCCGEGCKLRDLIGDDMIQTMTGLRDQLAEDPLAAAAGDAVPATPEDRQRAEQVLEEVGALVPSPLRSPGGQTEREPEEGERCRQ